MIHGIRNNNVEPTHGQIVSLLVPTRASPTGMDWQEARYDTLSRGFTHLATGRFYPLAIGPLWQEKTEDGE